MRHHVDRPASLSERSERLAPPRPRLPSVVEGPYRKPRQPWRVLRWLAHVFGVQ